MLPGELAGLLELDYDLALLGFDHDELAEILGPASNGRCDPDLMPELPGKPRSKRGDLWTLGHHRLLCGDATNTADVQRLMDGKRASLMATDPPYLVDYEGGTHPSSAANGGIVNGVRVGHDEKHWDAYLDHAAAVDFYRDFLRVALDVALTADVAVYQCFGMMRTEVIWQAWREVGLLAHQVVIWKKSSRRAHLLLVPLGLRGLMVGWPQGHKPKRNPPADTHAVWEIASSEGNEEAAGHDHPTIKPVELMRRPILWHTTPGGLIYEPFSGSGTALIAAEMSRP